MLTGTCWHLATSFSFTPRPLKAPELGQGQGRAAKLSSTRSHAHVSTRASEPGSRVQAPRHVKRTQAFFFSEKNSLRPNRPPAPTSSPNTPAQNGSGSCLWQDVNQGRAKWMSSLSWCAQDTPKLSPLLSLQSPGFRNYTMRCLKASNLSKLALVLYVTGASPHFRCCGSTEEWIKH